jgi:hypothetical protein
VDFARQPVTYSLEELYPAQASLSKTELVWSARHSA